MLPVKVLVPVRSNPPVGMIRLPAPLIVPAMAGVVPVPPVESNPPPVPSVMPRLTFKEALAEKSRRAALLRVIWLATGELGAAPKLASAAMVKVPPAIVVGPWKVLVPVKIGRAHV